MAITIKKSKLTLKTPAAEAPENSEVPAKTEQPAAESMPAKSQKKPGTADTIFQIVSLALAVMALIMFGALIGIQNSELSYYSKPPSAFPEFALQMPSAPSDSVPAPVIETPATPAPAVTSAPVAAAEAAVPEASTSAPPAAPDAPAK